MRNDLESFIYFMRLKSFIMQSDLDATIECISKLENNETKNEEDDNDYEDGLYQKLIISSNKEKEEIDDCNYLKEGAK